MHGGDPKLFRLQIDTAALVCHLYKIPDHPAYFKAACEQLRVDPPSLACRDVTEYYYSLLEPCPAPDEYCPQLDFDFDKKTIMTAPYAELVRGEAQRVGSRLGLSRGSGRAGEFVVD